jgi:HEAT repeat protein
MRYSALLILSLAVWGPPHAIAWQGDGARASTPPLPAEFQNLLNELKSDDRSKKVKALKALTDLGPRAEFATPQLIAILQHDDHHLRVLAIRCLGKIGAPAREAVPSLLAVLKSQSIFPHSRFEAAQALAAMGPAGEEAIPILVGTLKDPGESKKTRPSPTAAREAIGLTAPLMRRAKDGTVYYDSRDTEIGYALGGLAAFGASAREAVPLVEEIRDDPQTLPLVREIAVATLKALRGEDGAKPNDGNEEGAP